MKILFLFLILAVGNQGFAQTFTKGKRNDFKLCQENQNRLYQRILLQNTAQLKRIGDTIEEHSLSANRDDKFMTESLHRLMVATIVKKVILEKIIEQFNSRSLAQFMQSENDRREILYEKKRNGIKVNPADFALRDYLSYESLRVNMEKEVKDHVADMYSDRMLAVKEYIIGNFKWELTKQLVITSYSVFAKVGAGLFVQMSGHALKAAVLNIGASLFINAARGTILTLLIDPFLGARNPPESDWTDLLKNYNELILIPEWMKKSRVGDGSPWNTHCNAIVDRTIFMENRLKSYLEKDERLFESDLRVAKTKFNPRDFTLDMRSRIDNTRIKPYIPFQFNR